MPGLLWRRALVLSSLVSALAPAVLSSQQRIGARIVLFSPEANDRRIAWVDDAVSFWNQTFRELGLEPVWGETEVVLSSPVTRALETYARRVSQQAGRVVAGASGPAPPDELTRLSADVVVLLSSQSLLPFAWPLEGRYFIAIDDRNAEPADSERARNVIAHELGHALGLAHSDDPAALMCEPCRTTAWKDGKPVILRLTEASRLRLLELYTPTG